MFAFNSKEVCRQSLASQEHFDSYLHESFEQQASVSGRLNPRDVQAGSRWLELRPGISVFQSLTMPYFWKGDKLNWSNKILKEKPDFSCQKLEYYVEMKVKK